MVSLGNNIYACCWWFDKVYVCCYESEESEKKPIDIPGMKFPWDMIGYEIKDSENQAVEMLLISDNQWDDGCLRIVEHPNDDDKRKVGRIRVDGIPDKMSLIIFDRVQCVALLVRKKDTRDQFKWHLDIIKTNQISGDCTELTVHISFSLSCFDVIKHPWHVVQLEYKNLILLHETNSSTHEQHDFLITELSVTGNEIDIIQSIDPFYPTSKRNLWPQHMAIDENDRLYICDYGNELVVTVDYEFEQAKVFLDFRSKPIVGPIRLQYLKGQDQLLVAQVGQISVFQTEAYPTTGTYDCVKR